jgi:multicomponent Na+:H+ antiporter subunit D
VRSATTTPRTGKSRDHDRDAPVSRAIPLAVAVPLAAAAVTMFLQGRPTARRVVALGTAVWSLGFAVALLIATRDGDLLSTAIGGWPRPFAIVLVADAFSALMVTVTALTMLVCMAFASGTLDDRLPFFHTLALVLLAGSTGAFLTADLFNFFVFVEVMLIASHVLLTLPGTRRQLRAGGVYVTTNLLASTLLLTGIALIYGSVGTVNLGELMGLAGGGGPAAAGGLVVLVALSVKAAFFPVHGWLPSTYPSAPPAAAAMFSGLLTKVGLYGVFRMYSTLFDGDPQIRGVLLTVGILTMVAGVLGAIGRSSMREILSYHMVSQVGYMLAALGLSTRFGVAAAIFYAVQHIIVKTSLFLSVGAVETMEGTGTIERVGAFARRVPVVAAAFIVAALALAGLPPLSGFFAKLLVIRAAFDSGNAPLGITALVVSLLTLVSMLKVWNGVFWGDSPRERVGAPQKGLGELAGGGDGRIGRFALVAAPAALAVVAILLGVFANGLLSLSQRGAELLLDGSAYAAAVRGG